jgi:hypothetical protein
MTIFPLRCIHHVRCPYNHCDDFQILIFKGHPDSSQIHAHRTESKLKKKELCMTSVFFMRLIPPGKGNGLFKGFIF